ncbi:hypothetical protein [Pandoraea horticolens]|uniref:hypothetical protein n=1 Tax=Pandoraea horticolens TaxID=2508298 RepID=UPI0015831A17|nr:hypothetical protein [Pandoraea horticolens]
MAFAILSISVFDSRPNVPARFSTPWLAWASTALGLAALAELWALRLIDAVVD